VDASMKLCRGSLLLCWHDLALHTTMSWGFSAGSVCQDGSVTNLPYVPVGADGDRYDPVHLRPFRTTALIRENLAPPKGDHPFELAVGQSKEPHQVIRTARVGLRRSARDGRQ
jgi:hypothetical protein